MDPVFTLSEGAALAMLDALLGAGNPPRVPVRREPVRKALIAAAHQRMATAVVKFLVNAGGFRERVVLRGGRRVSGRIWDASVNQGFAPNFSPVSLQVWLEAAECLPVLVHARREPGPISGLPWSELRSTGRYVGDGVFLALALENLARFRLAAEHRALLTERLRAGSLVASMLAAQDAVTPEARAEIRAWMDMPAVRVFECAEDALVSAWLARAQALWGSRDSAESLIGQWRALERMIGAYMAAADEAGRMDLTRAVMRFSRALCERVLGEGGNAVRQRIGTHPGVRSLRERDELLGAIAGVAELGLTLVRRREMLATERYGDNRYEEAQLFLRYCAESLVPGQRAIESFVRALSPTMG